MTQDCRVASSLEAVCWIQPSKPHNSNKQITDSGSCNAVLLLIRSTHAAPRPHKRPGSQPNGDSSHPAAGLLGNTLRECNPVAPCMAARNEHGYEFSARPYNKHVGTPPRQPTQGRARLTCNYNIHTHSVEDDHQPVKLLVLGTLQTSLAASHWTIWGAERHRQRIRHILHRRMVSPHHNLQACIPPTPTSKPHNPLVHRSLPSPLPSLLDTSMQDDRALAAAYARQLAAQALWQQQDATKHLVKPSGAKASQH